MVPAHQSLEPHHLAREQVDEGLVVHVQLLEPQRLPQRRLHGDAVLELAVHDVAEHLHVVAAAVFRLVHGGIRMLQQLDHVRTIPGKHADADAARGLQRVLIDDDGAVQGLHYPARAQGHFVVRLDVAEYDDELVPAHADDDVGVAHAGAQTGSHLLKELVAGLMAPGVVDVFEPIEIQEHHPQHRTGGLSLGYGVRQERGEMVTIRQPGQLIVVRHAVQTVLILDELLFRLPAQGHIVGHVGNDVAAVHVERTASDFDVDEGAVLGALLNVHCHLGIGIAQPRRQGIGSGGAVCKDVQQRQGLRLGIGVAEAGQERRVCVENLLGLCIHDDDAVVRLIDDGLVARIGGCMPPHMAFEGHPGSAGGGERRRQRTEQVFHAAAAHFRAGFRQSRRSRGRRARETEYPDRPALRIAKRHIAEGIVVREMRGEAQSLPPGRGRCRAQVLAQIPGQRRYVELTQRACRHGTSHRSCQFGDERRRDRASRHQPTEN